MAENYVEPKTLAKIFNFDGVRRIDQLVQDGVIEPTIVTVNGRKVRRYDLIPTVMMYIKHLQNRAYARGATLADTADDEARRIKADADLKEAKAAIENMKKAELEATMHRSEDVEKIVTDLVTAIRAELLALPGTLAMDVAHAATPAEAAGIIRASVNNILNSLIDYRYNPEKFKKLVREREKWMNETENREETETDK